MPVLRPEERVGTVIGGRYRIDEIIGSGGMGVVYSGAHTWTERPVAVKVLSVEHLEEERAVRRFFQEAKTAAKLHHPSVVDVLDMGETRDGAPFLVLELLTGESLLARVMRGPMPVHDAVAFVLPLMDALATAHAVGIIHRDIKPANLFLHVAAKGNVVPKLVDFGISKLMGTNVSMPTATGTLIGTPHYMSPEQIAAAKTISGQTDVWSMGVVLFEALAGRRPFEGQIPLAVVVKISTEAAPPLREVASHVPEPIADAVDGALKKNLPERHADMPAFIDALLAGARASGIEVVDPRHVHASIPPPE